MSAFRPSASSGGTATVDLSPISTALADKASQASVDAVAAAVAAGSGSGAEVGEVRTFAAQVPAGYAQVAGPLPSYGLGTFQFATSPLSVANQAVLASTGTVVYCLRNNTSQGYSSFAYLDQTAAAWVDLASVPVSGFWTSAKVGALVALADGRVLAFGYGLSSSTAGAHVYSPTTQAWSAVASMPTLVRGASGVLLQDGRVLGLAGTNAYVYSPDTNAWVTAASAPSGVTASNSAASLVLLPSGFVLAATTTAYAIYDPLGDSWSTASVFPDGFSAGYSPLLLATDTGCACLSGYGATTAAPALIYAFSEAAGTWAATATKTPLPGGTLTTGASVARLPTGAHLCNPGAAVYINEYTPTGLVLGRKT